MATVSDVTEIALAFLATAEDALALTPAGTPGRSYYSPGEPALDCCGQLTVWVSSMSDSDLFSGVGALSRGKAVNRGTVPTITIFIQATRCLTDRSDKNGMPFPDDLQEAAITVDEDGWALRCHFLAELRHGTLKEVCEGATFLGAQKMTPQGGCVGWIFSFQYELEGGIIGT